MDEYAGRLRHYTKLELLELPARSRSEEGDAILSKSGKSEWLIALDERGEQPDSPGLAQLIGKAQQQAKDLLFVVGGDDGLDPRVTQAAHKVVSLSKMTLPHRLARVVLMEQLYRAFTILRGEPYHRA